MTISEILIEASKDLQNNNIDDPRREASLLLGYAISKDKTFMFAHPEYMLETVEEERFRAFIERRSKREPFHYITGRKEFYGLNFEVTPDVLIPRPETEMLVQHSIEYLRELKDPVFCEVGVGSGCISVSILYNVKTSSAIGLEISEAAIEVAKRNSVRNFVQDRLRLKYSDMYSALKDEKFDLIVSNPPYVPSTDIDGLQPEVKDFEPHLALTDSDNGLSKIKMIVDGSPRLLKSNGFLFMEIGMGQADTVKEMFDPALWYRVEILPDFQAIPRMVRARLR